MGSTSTEKSGFFNLSPEIQREILQYLEIFQCLILALVLLPGAVLVISLSLSYRLILTLIYKFAYKGRFSLASLTDSTYAVETHANTITTTTFTYFKGPADIQGLRDNMSKNLVNYVNEEGQQPFKRFSWRLVRKFGYFTWEDRGAQFDIRNHVKLCPGADQPDRVYTEQEVLEAIEKLADNVLNPELPQWEALVVPKVKLGGKGDDDIHYAVVFRVYHALVDGISLLRCLQKILDEPNNVKYAIDPLKPPIRKPSTLELIGHYVQVLLLGPYSVYKIYRTTRLHPENVFQDMKVNTGPKYMGCTTMKMTMDDVKMIRKAFNCSTVAVFNSVIGGALRKAAERKGLPVPKGIDFGFTAAVLPYPNENPQNRFVIAGMRSPLAMKDPVSRLTKLDAIMKKSFSAHDLTTLFWMGTLTGCLPAALIHKIVDQMHSGYVLTNVPGLTEKVHMGGSPMEENYGIPPIKNGIGFGIGVTSYMGNIRVGWIVEKTSIIESREDMNALVADYETEFSILQNTANKCLNLNNN